jgi:hypothetical protein
MTLRFTGAPRLHDSTFPYVWSYLVGLKNLETLEFLATPIKEQAEGLKALAGSKALKSFR